MSHRISIIGLGAGELDQMPVGIYKLLKRTDLVYARTLDHPVLKELIEEGLSVESFDKVYEKHDRFEEVYEEIAQTLLQRAEQENIVYAVPGHPLIAEKTVQLLLEEGDKAESEIQVEIIGGQSFLDAMFTAVKVDPVEGFQFLDGTDLHKRDLNITQHMIISQVYDAFIASDVKLTLMEKYPDEHEVYLVTGAGMSTEKVERLALYELDRAMQLSNLTSVYVPPLQKEEQQYQEFWKLREIIDILRSPEGCPWDREQTHESLRRYLIEEAYELVEAINNEDIDGIIDELGDVLLQVMLHARIGEDEGYFSIDDVIQNLARKMIRRHPHVFGDETAKTAEDVVETWQRVKGKEKSQVASTVLEGINPALPNLMQAWEIQKKAAKAGFDWDDVKPAWEKVLEELEEFMNEWQKENPEPSEMEAEFGDILFALVNVARFLDIRPEEALYRTNQKFRHRFQFVEDKVRESGKGWANFTLEELDEYWELAKKSGL